MKASIHDKHLLATLRPLEIISYLRSTGWQQSSIIPDRWTTWVKDGDFEIALPLTRDFGDFVLRMADALRTLEAVEERSQIEILNDLLTSCADILRFRITDAEADDGTTPIEEGAQIVQRTCDLIMAGACAAIEKRALFQSRKPAQAVEYLKKVRMGQTERGSYVITVISRVAPNLRVEDNGHSFKTQEPFERQATMTLMKAVAAANRAASNAVSTDDFHGFQAAVNEGVSANLCDALYGIASGGEANRGLEIRCSWSRSRPVDSESIQSRVTFLPDSMPVFQEAARLFRETTARDDFELQGPVVKLERAEGSSVGKVTVFGVVDEQPRKILMDLEDQDYHKAVQAHDNQETIRCCGLLVREGRSFVLRNPRNLYIMSDM